MSEGSYQYSDMEEIMKSITQVFDAITYFVAAVAVYFIIHCEYRCDERYVYFSR